ncbi:hypothetical protein [Nesterenkonia xinjiangensis]|uniref:Uncharacterized protein n=1 Tax=Nesterenkonia xinjiangensis TaxID=225327 RepID=A0A7Z0KAP4_9MICC|nr:hypothetical protein [Nesterenkonia xinjiangensis]NYJ78500.1 hypothetical protein [Nesterenkonia xinjiangensis]
MRWRQRNDWGPRALAGDEWAVLEAQIDADDLDAVENAVEELTGFMDSFREDVDGRPLVGVTDGQLSVTQHYTENRRGRRVLQVIFYATGPVGVGQPHAFDRLGSAATSLVDHLQADGIALSEIRWTERPYQKRPF